MLQLLPPELWTEILVRLPVRTLLTLKCVSKSFLSIIQNPNFPYLHFSRFNNCYSESKKSDLLLLEHFSDTQLGVCRGNILTKTLEFEFGKNKRDVVVGYVDGLVWLHRFKYGGAILFNPSIRRYFFIPHSRTLNLGCNIVGFGYDPLTGDYKAVVIVLAAFDPSKFRFPAQSEPLTRTEVFSLRKGSWRSLGGGVISQSWALGMGAKNVYANGAIHWLARDNVNNPLYFLDSCAECFHVVSFDLGTEVFRFRELPKVNDDDDEYDNPFERPVKLPMSYRGLFAVCYVSRFHICVWVMMEDGWTKEWMIESSHEFFCYLSKVRRNNHVYFNNAIFSETAGELLIDTHKEGVISYNFNTCHYTLHKGVNCIGMYVENLRWRELLTYMS